MDGPPRYSYLDCTGQPAGPADRWIQTVPGRGWFCYFRIYGPGQAAFDGTWRPGDVTPEHF